jgi:hypothetical protein
MTIQAYCFDNPEVQRLATIWIIRLQTAYGPNDWPRYINREVLVALLTDAELPLMKWYSSPSAASDQVPIGSQLVTPLERFAVRLESAMTRTRPTAAPELLDIAKSVVSFLRCVEWDKTTDANESAALETALDIAIAKAEGKEP